MSNKECFGLRSNTMPRETSPKCYKLVRQCTSYNFEKVVNPQIPLNLRLWAFVTLSIFMTASFTLEWYSFTNDFSCSKNSSLSCETKFVI